MYKKQRWPYLQVFWMLIHDSTIWNNKKRKYAKAYRASVAWLYHRWVDTLYCDEINRNVFIFNSLRLRWWWWNVGLRGHTLKVMAIQEKKKSNIYIGWLIIEKASSEKLHFHQGKKKQRAVLLFQAKAPRISPPPPNITPMPPKQKHRPLNIRSITTGIS